MLGLLQSPGRLWRTIRHLQMEQITGRVHHAIRGRIAPLVGPLLRRRMEVDQNSALSPDLSVLRRWSEELPTLMHLDGSTLAWARDFANGDVTLLGHRVDFNGPIDWNHQESGRLWAFELHYLDCLPVLLHSASHNTPEDEKLAAMLLEDWEAGNPLGSDPAWNPYTTSLRLVNLLRSAACTRDAPIRTHCLEMAATHASWLAPILETHLGGNHLLANLKALLLATATLPLHRGLRDRHSKHVERFTRCLRDQFLADGGHCERSPMYHSLLTRDLREMLAVTDETSCLPSGLRSELADTTRRAEEWNAILRHPDGGLAFFNDTNLREFCPIPTDLREGEPHIALHPSGYHRLRRGPWHLLWDCGAIGPDHQPGHAHADILSVEASFHGCRLFVNTGLRGYADDPRRAHVRSTAAHNTVQIGSAEQVELWGCFRVGERGVPVLDHSGPDGDSLRLAGHYAWPTLPHAPVHFREVRIDAQSALHLRDQVRGDVSEWTTRLLLHPDVSIEDRGDALVLETPSGKCQLIHTGGTRSVERATWHPDFGEDMSTHVVRIQSDGDCPVTIEVTPLQA